MTKAVLLEQLENEKIKLSQLKAVLDKTNSEHLEETRRYCESDGGSERQEALRERALHKSRDNQRHAEQAFKAQELVVQRLLERIEQV